MNSEIIHNQIQGLLEAIQEQYEAIRATEGVIPQIEFDILLDNLRKMYDQLHLLQKFHTPSHHDVTTTPPRPSHSTVSPSPTPPTSPSPATPSPAAIPKAPSTPPIIKSVQRPPSSIRKEEEAKTKGTPPADLDLFAGEEPTFSMKLKEAREMSLPQKPEPVGHLKELIGINDKFIFINELFDGNLKEYNETIETLNGFSVKAEAFDYLDRLRRKNLWELGSGTFMKLKELVEKYCP